MLHIVILRNEPSIGFIESFVPQNDSPIKINLFIKKPSLISFRKKIFLIFFILSYFLSSAQNDSLVFIKGKIVSSASAIPGLQVSLTNIGLHTITNIDGAFIFYKIHLGSYTLQINGIGFTSKILQFTTSPMADTDLGVIEINVEKTLQGVEVVGEMANSQLKAQNMIKNSNQQISVISAAELDKQPVKNAADAVAHMQNVTVQRNQGENSLVALRGTPADWSATLLNGDRLPVADEEQHTRTFEFEALSSEIIDYVIETRTSSPDSESDNIGGSINFISRRPVSQKTLQICGALGYNQFSEKPTGNFNFLAGHISKNKKLSFVIDGSYYGRNYGSNMQKTIIGNSYNYGINRLELRRYDGFRSTYGTNAAIEYKINSFFKIGLNAIGGLMTDDKYMKKQSFNWLDGEGECIRLQSTHALLIRQIYGGNIYAEINPTSRIKIDLKAAHYRNDFHYGPVPTNNKNDKRNGFFVTEFKSRYGTVTYLDNVTTDKFGNADPNGEYIIKLAGNDNPYGGGDSYTNIQPKTTVLPQTNDFEFTQSYTETNQTRETDPLVTQADVQYTLNNNLKIKIGSKTREKVGYRRISQHQWRQLISAANSTALNLQDFELTSFSKQPQKFLSEQGADYSKLQFPFLSNKQLNSFLEDNQLQLIEVPMNKLNSKYVEWVGSTYDYKEQQLAAYGMFELSLKKINITAGLRLEQTKLYQTSDTLIFNKVEIDPVTNNAYFPPEQRVTNSKYLSWLPALNSTYFVNSKSNLRLATSRTMHRPNFEETKPGAAIIRYNELIYTVGNPQLKPAYALNVDLAFENFSGNDGMWSVGAYYKHITDNIFKVTTANTLPSGLLEKSFQNASNAWVIGLEAVLVRKLTFLPGKLKNFGVNLNFTYSTSQMKVPGRDISQRMAEQTPFLCNAGLLYEGKNIDSQFEFSYNSGYLKELNLTSFAGSGIVNKNSSFDIFTASYFSLDYQFGWKFKKYFTLFAEANNLLNYADKRYIGSKERLIHSENYGLKGQLGLKFDL
jgi:TonB-dependent receptor